MKLKFNSDGLVPAIIQDYASNEVLMLGYMNEEAIELSKETQKVTFFSRSKKRLWTKGESSGNFLKLISISLDCDQDALLVKVIPNGPTCHKGTASCWGDHSNVLNYLERIIAERALNSDDESYVSSLFKKGINKIAQKVGEEAVEVVIEAKDDNDELFLNESADLLFHYLVLLNAKGFGLKDVLQVLEKRRK